VKEFKNFLTTQEVKERATIVKANNLCFITKKPLKASFKRVFHNDVGFVNVNIT